MIEWIPLLVFSLFVYICAMSRVWSHLTPWVDAYKPRHYNDDNGDRKFARFLAAVFWPIWILQWPFRLAWWLGKPIGQ